MKNTIITAVIGLLVGIIAGYAVHQPATLIQQLGGGAAVGTTGSTPRVAQIVANGNGAYVSGTLGSGVYTIASIANGDANDRVILGVNEVFVGLGTNSTSTATYTIQAATSSDTTTLNSNTNYVINNAFSTSTPTLVASTTALSGSTNGSIWKAGSNLNVVANGTTSAEVILQVLYITE